jgi:ubiquinone/menaquinone biosynthesis C-methylase UbiE
MTKDRATIERFKRQVEEEWQNPQVTAGYRKWCHEDAEWARAARDLMIHLAKLAPGMNVLDIGSARGEPALAIAEVVGPTGHVTLTDIAPGLLEVSAERAVSMKAVAEIYDVLHGFYDGEIVNVPMEVNVALGSKPV